MKKVSEKIALFVMLIWVSMTSAQNPSKVFFFQSILLNRDLVTIQVQNADSISVKYWKYAHVGLEVAVHVTPDRVKFLDDLEERYTPTITSFDRATAIKFDKLDDIITISEKYWKDRVTITVYLPEIRQKTIVLEDKNSRREWVQEPSEPVSETPPDYGVLR